VFPVCSLIVISNVFVQKSTTVASASGAATVAQTTGTWQFKTYGATPLTAVEPASGDEIIISYYAQWSKA
jgi:hypothetical protein